MIIRKLKGNIKYALPPKVFHSLIYLKSKKHRLNWRKPTLYDEKIHWLIVHMYDNRYGKYADKFLVRDYVKACGLENLLIPLLGVYDSAEEIEYDRLPDKFILKATHGSGDLFYEICTNRTMVDRMAINKKMNNALKEEFFKYFCEYQYEGIKPRIICEELLETPGVERLNDYKVVCANGKAAAILVCTNRDEGRDYYSTDWQYLEYVKDEFRSKEKIEKPEQLQEMIRAAEILSKPFPLARVDFYIIGEKLYFGEITLTPSAGNHKYLNEMGQKELGGMITLPQL